MQNSTELSQAKLQLSLQQKALQLLAKRELGRRHLLNSTHFFHPTYQENWHHLLIAEKLEAIERGELRRLMVFMPPRHGKSELVSIQFPTWYLGRNPTKEIIQTSYSSELALDFGRKVRTNVGRQEFHQLFPKAQLSELSKAADQFRLTQGGGYLAVGVGGSVTGRGGNVVIIDDPHKDAKEAASGTLRDMVWQWYTGTLYTRLNPNGAMILVMTRWHDDDLAGRILNSKQGGTWEVLKLPAIATEDEPQRKKGEALWPQSWPLEVLHDKENTQGPYNFAAQFQQDPVSGEAQVFKPEWFKTTIPEAEVEKQQTLRFLALDTASSMKEGSNSIGMVDCRVNTQGKWYLKARKFKMDPKEFADTLFTLQKLNNYMWIGIEKTMFLEGFKPYLDLQQDITGQQLPIFQLQHKQTAKEVRIRGLVPFLKNGTIVLIDGQCEELVTQLLRFPKSAEDDVADACAYLPQIVQAPLGWGKSDFQTTEDGRPMQEPFDPHNPLPEI
jgi:hypothetical protein